jgi:hypothetical protein
MTANESFPTFFARVRQQPVYVILGVQGSGTNLLRSILVRAFRFSVVQDKALVFKTAAQLGAAPSPEDVRRQFKRLKTHLVPSTVARKTRQLVKTNGSFAGIERHFDEAGPRTAADLATFVYGYSAYSLGTSLMAVKSDDLWEHIGQMDLLMPNRRVILLTRDFRDNLLSITKKDFGPLEPFVAARYVSHRFALLRD